MRLQVVRLILGSCLAIAALPSVASADLPRDSFVLDNGVISMVRGSDGASYIGGDFTTEQTPTGAGIAVSETGSGQPDPATLAHVVGSITASASDGNGGWFIGGAITYVDGTAVSRLAHIHADGSLDPLWKPNASGGSGAITALAATPTTVIVAGDFDHIGGQARSGLAAVDRTTATATSWDPSPDGAVYTLLRSGATVWAGGAFTSIGGSVRPRLAALDDTGHAQAGFNAQVDSSPGSSVGHLALSSNTLYATGRFQSLGGQARKYAGAVDASTGAVTTFDAHLQLAGDLGAGPISLAAGPVVAAAGAIYIGGNFTSAGGQSRVDVAALNPTTGDALSWDAGIQDYPLSSVNAIAVAGSTLYLAGAFQQVGGQPRRGAAAVDTTSGAVTSWNPQPNNSVSRLEAAEGDVFIGGEFTGAGTPLASIKHLAKLNPDGSLNTSWNPQPTDGSAASTDTLTFGQDHPTISALALAAGKLYLSGDFQHIGGQPRHSLGAVDASTGTVTSWAPDLTGQITTMAASDSTLYVGGDFSAVGGQSRDNLAAIDVATGQPTSFAPEPDQAIRHIALSGSTLYAAGPFTTIAGHGRDGLAALETSTATLTAFNPTTGGAEIDALAASAQQVYVGGLFSSMSGATRNGAAAFNASTGALSNWNPNVGGPFSGPGWVSALAVDQNTVYIGGYLTSVGGAPRSGLAAVSADTGALAPFDPQLTALGDPDSGYIWIYGLTVAGGKVFAAGTFAAVGSHLATGYAQISTIVDTSAPTINIATPSEGQSFTVGQAVTASFACDDGDGSGVASCDGPSTVDTITAGSHTFTVSATDSEGNASTKTVHYEVAAANTGPGNSGTDDSSSGGGAPGTNPPGSGAAAGTGTPAKTSGAGGATTVPLTQTASSVKALLDALAKAASRSKLLKSGISFSFTAPQPGKLTIKFYLLSTSGHSAKKTLSATATAKATHARKVKVTMRLTPAGKRALRRLKHASAQATATFAPSTGTPTSASKSFNITH